MYHMNSTLTSGVSLGQGFPILSTKGQGEQEPHLIPPVQSVVLGFFFLIDSGVAFA